MTHVMCSGHLCFNCVLMVTPDSVTGNGFKNGVMTLMGILL